MAVTTISKTWIEVFDSGPRNIAKQIKDQRMEFKRVIPTAVALGARSSGYCPSRRISWAPSAATLASLPPSTAIGNQHTGASTSSSFLSSRINAVCSQESGGPEMAAFGNLR
ncbi:hypothetical protein C8R44DRAFT_738411 [Mycena epipterygia]|nr:hypothetical protein C8R44DRAFT_738411 [Mycena epipterygia]